MPEFSHKNYSNGTLFRRKSLGSPGVRTSVPDRSGCAPGGVRLFGGLAGGPDLISDGLKPTRASGRLELGGGVVLRRWGSLAGRGERCPGFGASASAAVAASGDN